LLGFANVSRYTRGKADWIVRGMPTEPRAGLRDRIRALPFFLNNLFPAMRKCWIRISLRRIVAQSMADDVLRVAIDSAIPEFAQKKQEPLGVVLSREGVLLGALDGPGGTGSLIERMNPAPQTIRPDMTPALAAMLLRNKPYLLVTTEDGVYLGRYQQHASR
jgi:hypothetical protein